MSRTGPALLVEANPDDVGLTRLALAEGGIANPLPHLPDGEQARDSLLATGHASGDMPVVRRRLRADTRTRYLPVVMPASRREERDIAESCRNGAYSHVQWSVKQAEFVRAVRDVSRCWALLNLPASGGVR